MFSHVFSCSEFIEREGLDAEGLYRVPGNRAHVDLLFAKFDDDKVRMWGVKGPHGICFCNHLAVLWIWIRSDLELFAGGSGSVIINFGSGFDNLQFFVTKIA